MKGLSVSCTHALDLDRLANCHGDSHVRFGADCVARIEQVCVIVHVLLARRIPRLPFQQYTFLCSRLGRQNGDGTDS
jgi:hypothetical protein